MTLNTTLPPVPKFLRRKPGDAAKIPAARSLRPWKLTPSMKAAAKRARKKRDGETAGPKVCAAVKAGADTFGKIRKATGLDDALIRAGLRAGVKSRRIAKVRRRYYPA